MGELASQLNRFCQLRGTNWELSYVQLPDTSFECQLHVPGVDYEAHGVATNKKRAFESSVQDMYNFLDGNGMLSEVLDRAAPNSKRRKVAGNKNARAASPSEAAVPKKTGLAAPKPVGLVMPGGKVKPVALKSQVAPPVVVVPGAPGPATPAPKRVPLAPPPAPAEVASAASVSASTFKQGTAVKAEPSAHERTHDPNINLEPLPSAEDGPGNFTLEVARSQLNQQLQKWKQKNDMELTCEGPQHQPIFRARLRFKVPKLGAWVEESILCSTKKQAQNELALKLCRKLYAMGVMPKFSRSIRGRTFQECLKESSYYEADAFGVDIPANLKRRLWTYLKERGYGLPQLGEDLPPGYPLLDDMGGLEDCGLGPEIKETIEAVPWAPPGSVGWKPWPDPGPRPPSTRPFEDLTRVRMSLPVFAMRDKIVSAITDNQVSIVQGATGSGKTTQVPQYIIDTEDGMTKTVVVAQPRRLAAMTVAHRVATERMEPLGESVGFAVRFDAVWPRHNDSICYMTSGLLLKRMHSRGLHGISHVVVDEVHERDLHNDLLLAVLRFAISCHEGLKVVLMSATIDATKFKQYMTTPEGVPAVLAIKGRTFEVETYYLEDAIEQLGWTPPPRRWESSKEPSMNTVSRPGYSRKTIQTLANLPEQEIPLDLAKDLVRAIVSGNSSNGRPNGSVLVFLPTWSTMALLQKMLQGESDLVSRIRIVMLHSHVPKSEQMDAFRASPKGITKVVLATNIAESSVTVDDVEVVIDSCRAKLTFCSDRTGLSHHEVVWTGRMNLEQRKGRAGRTRPGVCYRLCSLRRFEQGMSDEVPPELLRTPLVEAALLVKSLGLGEITSVLGHCLDPPPEQVVVRAVTELRRLRALDERQRLTKLGRILARLPIDPHIGLALLLGHWLFQLGDAMALICAAMSFDEPFPYEKNGGYLFWSIIDRFQGRQKHSDQFLLAQVHQEYSHLLDTRGEQAASRFCSSEGLHPAIMRQVREATGQLRQLLESQALGALALAGEPIEAEPEAEALEELLHGTDRNHPSSVPTARGIGGGKPRGHLAAIRDWGPQDWQWGALQLLIAMATPRLVVHQERRHVWVAEDTIGAMHKGSVNCCKNDYLFPTPLFAYLDQVKEGETWKPPRCRQLTAVPPLTVLLRPFAPGTVQLDEEGVHAIVEGWVPLGPVASDTACLLLGLRLRLEDYLTACAEQAPAGLSAVAEDAELRSLIQELVSHAQRFRRVTPGQSAVQPQAAEAKPRAAEALGRRQASEGVRAWRPLGSVAVVARRGTDGWLGK